MEVSTAVDTAGNIPWEYFQRILPYTDLFLYDLKSMDCNQHQKFTGVDNGRILTNLNKLKKNSPIWVRIPCIKNVNDSDKEIEAYCRYLQHADNIQRIELIPYHSYGNINIKCWAKVFRTLCQWINRYHKFYRKIRSTGISGNQLLLRVYSLYIRENNA